MTPSSELKINSDLEPFLRLKLLAVLLKTCPVGDALAASQMEWIH